MTYDTAYALARELKESDDYKNYAAAKEAVFSNESNAAVMKEYKRLTMEGQAYILAKKEMPSELMEKLQKLQAVLQLSPECVNYLMYEYKIHMTFSEIMKILTDEIDIDLAIPGLSDE